MFATVIAFFVQRPSLIALACLAVAFGVQHVELSSARGGEKSAKADLVTCRSSLKTVNDQEQARAEQSRKALEAASKAQASVAPLASRINGKARALEAHVPKGSDRCQAFEDAEAAVREALK